MFLSKTGTVDTYDILINIIWKWQEFGISHVNHFLANYKIDGQSITFEFVLHWQRAENQHDNSKSYQYAGYDTSPHDVSITVIHNV